MLISIIVPVYNASLTIRQTVDSVLSQTYTDFELVIINDGSTDDSLEVLKTYRDERISIITQKNSGVSAARNKGIQLATGEYIALLDSDDIWLPSKLAIQANILINEPHIDFLGCNRNNEKTNVGFHKYNKLKKIEFRDMLFKTFPQTSTVIIRKKIFEDVGFFDEKQHYCEDANLFLRICAKKTCYMMPESLVITGNLKPNFGYSGLSANLSGMTRGVLKNLKDIYELQYINILEFCFHYIFNVMKHIRRVIIVSIRKTK